MAQPKAQPSTHTSSTTAQDIARVVKVPAHTIDLILQLAAHAGVVPGQSAYPMATYSSPPEPPLNARVASPPPASPPATKNISWAVLTPQQRQVLGGLFDGLTNQQIAKRMGVKVGTVKQHLTLARDKLGLKGQRDREVQAWLREHGFVA